MNGRHSIASLFKTEIDEICASLIVQNEEIYSQELRACFTKHTCLALARVKSKIQGIRLLLRFIAFCCAKGL